MHFIDQCSLTDYCVILDSHRLCLWRLGCSVVFVIAIWLDVEVELGASDLLVDGQNVLGTGLEVTGSVVTLGDVQVLSNCIIGWLVDVTDLDEHFLHFADEGEGWSNLLLWVISLDIRGDDHDVESLSANGVSMRDHSDVDVYTKKTSERINANAQLLYILNTTTNHLTTQSHSICRIIKLLDMNGF